MIKNENKFDRKLNDKHTGITEHSQGKRNLSKQLEIVLIVSLELFTKVHSNKVFCSLLRMASCSNLVYM